MRLNDSHSHYSRIYSVQRDGLSYLDRSPMTENELVIMRPASLLRPSIDSHDHAPNAGAGAHPADGPTTATEEAYFTAEMRTFPCGRVRKMPLSGLDPDMLIGFVVRDAAVAVTARSFLTQLGTPLVTFMPYSPPLRHARQFDATLVSFPTCVLAPTPCISIAYFGEHGRYNQWLPSQASSTLRSGPPPNPTPNSLPPKAKSTSS
ncbi:hypothetical protein K438DRAFT_1992792 [Mycena galopus ATCC 62051]|nr:hypothetical protein K438DRAFT_1992792 [Mycena galopus ATCC 62051]